MSSDKKQSILSRSIEHAIAATNSDNINPEMIAQVVKLDDQTVKIDQDEYLLVTDHAGGFDANRLAMRYNSVLKKYDYIVGDWGYGQLRLRGFYDVNRKQAKIDQRINTLQDYLFEYCNFGCAYFVLEKKHKPAVIADNYNYVKKPRNKPNNFRKRNKFRIRNIDR